MESAKIIICDDEKIFTWELEKSLESMGHRVQGTANSFQDVIDLATRLQPDLVLMDIDLGGESGIAAARQLNEQLAIPSIFLTGSSDAEIVARAAETRPVGYLLKPIQLHELQIAIEIGMTLRKSHDRVKNEIERYQTIFKEGAISSYVPFHKNMSAFLEHEVQMQTARDISGKLAHHLNNRWMSVEALLTYLESLHTFGTVEKQCLREVHIEVERCSSILQRMLWATAQGCYEIAPAPLEPFFKEVVDEAISNLPIEITVLPSYEGKARHARIDQRALKAALNALLMNASEAMGGKGTITLTCSSQYVENPKKNNARALPGWYAAFQIRDSGASSATTIEDEDFIPFSTSKDSDTALGLGLSVAHGVAQALGGWIEVDSRFGEGTAVYMLIPETPSPDSTQKRTADSLHPSFQDGPRLSSREKKHLPSRHLEKVSLTPFSASKPPFLGKKSKSLAQENPKPRGKLLALRKATTNDIPREFELL